MRRLLPLLPWVLLPAHLGAAPAPPEADRALPGQRAQPHVAPHPGRPAHTYSIIARDPATGELGVAVQSHWFAVGLDVPWAEPGVGVVATQSFVNPAYGLLGLDQMRAGKAAPEVLRLLVLRDQEREVRQVAMMDAQGRVAAHTGNKCIAAAGHHVGQDYAVQANLMASDKVWPAMAAAFEGAQGDLAERMLVALEAAQRAGGDLRGQQSAALIVVSGRASGRPWLDRRFHLRVDDHPAPLRELRRLVTMQRAYRFMNNGDAAMERKDHAAALRSYEAASKLAPDNPEIAFWYAVSLTNMGRKAEALPLFQRAIKEAPGWRDLPERLMNAGHLQKDPALLQALRQAPPGPTQAPRGPQGPQRPPSPQRQPDPSSR